MAGYAMGDPIEAESDELHRRIAARVRRDPRIIDDAAAILRQWIRRDGDPPHPVLLEWQAVLDMLAREELAEFLESPLPRARRLRASSPFAPLARDG